MEAMLFAVVGGVVVMVVCLSIVAVVALAIKGNANVAQEAIKALASVFKSWVKHQS